MEEQLFNVARFYVLATKLKYKIRSGWDYNHWNINNERIESIAEHVYGTCILALAIDSEFNTNLDMFKVLKMLVIHELGEVIIGDITPFDGMTDDEKFELESRAVQSILGDLIKKDEYYDLWEEFTKKTSKEAIFAYLCDKLEADIQSKIYQDMGCHNSLDNQEHNVAFTKKRTLEIVEEGAKTAFDIWYQYDKKIYKNDIRFYSLLNYFRSIDTQDVA